MLTQVCAWDVNETNKRDEANGNGKRGKEYKPATKKEQRECDQKNMFNT